MSAPAIPAGYRRLKVGEIKPKGYKFWSESDDAFSVGYWEGEEVTDFDMAVSGPYIAPVRRRKGGKKGRAK